MDELEAAAIANGIQAGPQMARFLLWVGNECFEGREVPDFAVLAGRARILVRMFLMDDQKADIRRELEVQVKRVCDGGGAVNDA